MDEHTICHECGERCVTVMEDDSDTGLCPDCYDHKEQTEHYAYIKQQERINRCRRY